MSTPQRIQLSRRAGFRLPPDAVNVARPSKWGNPFKVTPERSQALAVGAFRTWLTVDGCHADMPERKAWILENLPRLRGKHLACWCHAGTVCHGDVLMELAAETEPPRPMCCFGVGSRNPDWRCDKPATHVSTFNRKLGKLFWCDEHCTAFSDGLQTQGHAITPLPKPLDAAAAPGA